MATKLEDKVGEGCPGPSYRDIIDRDSTPVSSVLARKANPAQPTTDIPFEHYISQDFFNIEMEKVWSKVWQIACRTENLREVGDYFVYDIGRYSILIVRAGDDEIKAFHNSCMHRGTKLKPSASNGFADEIQCPFHGWTYQLDGTLDEVPCSWEFPHLDYGANHLAEVQVDVWNSFVFINMDPEAMSLLDYLEVLPEHFENWSYEGWYTFAHTQKELACNYKVAHEGFMEAYHTPIVHPEMTQVVGDWNMQHDIFGDHVSRDLCPMGVSSPSKNWDLSEQELLDRARPGDPGKTGEEAARPQVTEGKTARIVMADLAREAFAENFDIDLSALSDAEIIDSLKYNIFPNLMMSGSPTMRAITLFKPNGMDPDRCIMERFMFRPIPQGEEPPEPPEPVRIKEDESWGLDPTISEFQANVLDQDTSIMRWQQEGMHASSKGAESLSNYQESRIRRMHETLEKYVRA